METIPTSLTNVTIVLSDASDEVNNMIDVEVFKVNSIRVRKTHVDVA